MSFLCYEGYNNYCLFTTSINPLKSYQHSNNNNNNNNNNNDNNKVQNINCTYVSYLLTNCDLTIFTFKLRVRKESTGGHITFPLCKSKIN